jgi:predicted MPP superfamily phosphohydrolase
LNTHVKIEKNGQSIILAWVENRWTWFVCHGDIDQALKWVDKNEFIVLLSHDPTHREAVVKHYPIPVSLTLSWHTHGMQMGFDFSRWKWSPIKYRYKKRIWLYTFGKRLLYVNRGFGFLGLSARVGIWPEITAITIRKTKM